jgi:hypothetical protein
MQASERPITWRCGHRYPSVVDTTKEGGQACPVLGLRDDRAFASGCGGGDARVEGPREDR